MKKKAFAVLVAALVAAAGAAVLSTGLSASAAKNTTHHFIALLNSTQENKTTTGFGVAYMSLTPDGEFCYHITYSGLTADESAAHFHIGGPGVVGGPTILGLPLGNPKTDCLAREELDDRFVPLLKKNELYINIHTEGANATGEIHGQVLRTK